MSFHSSRLAFSQRTLLSQWSSRGPKPSTAWPGPGRHRWLENKDMTPRMSLVPSARIHTSSLRLSAAPIPFEDESKEQSYSEVHFPRRVSRQEEAEGEDSQPATEHAVVSIFDLYSIGLGPSSSHTIGPMRAATIFLRDILDDSPDLWPRISRLKIALYGALAATGEGHLTPQALCAGFEGQDPENANPTEIPQRYQAVLKEKKLILGKHLKESNSDPLEVSFDYQKDLSWNWDKSLPFHPNGMRFSVFDTNGDLLATNDYFSVGGGFVVNGKLATQTNVNRQKEETDHPQDMKENAFYKEIRRSDADESRRHGSSPAKEEGSDPAGLPDLSTPGESQISSDGEKDNQHQSSSTSNEIPLPFHNGASLLRLCYRHNLTMAQIVFQNELTWRSADEIRARIFKVWNVMDSSIRAGCHSKQERLPGPMKLKRRAPGLYKRLMRGLYTGGVGLPDQDERSGALPHNSGNEEMLPDKALPTEMSTASQLAPSSPPRVHGSVVHHPLPTPPRRSVSNRDVDFLSVFAIAVNEENAAGTSLVATAPTLGSSGTLPSVLRWHLSFHSDDPGKDVETFLLTAAAICQLIKRGASISAAEGGCMSEIGVSTTMAAAGLTAVRGGTPAQIERAAEIALEQSLGMTCDPIGGQVIVPCIERNAIGAVKAVTASHLALASEEYAVTLDQAIAAMKETGESMSERFKETSLGGLATAVKIPVSVPAC
ncbi:unnamed protein product [Sympodiomycopsis kandeliae]